MKLKFSALVIALLVCVGADASTITVTMTNGTEQEFGYSKRVLHKKGVRPASGGVIDFDQITTISTADFDAYEQAVKVTSRKNASHVTVRYTGEGDVNALRLEKLERKRQGAGVARGAGGLMMLLGVLGGDEDVYAAGLVTYGAGTIAKDINTDKTIEAQNQAIKDLQKQQQEQPNDLSLEDQYRMSWGNEVVDGVAALLEGNHARALALANAGETSADANHRLAAAWLKAIIAADQGDTAAAEKEYERLVILDPELGSVEEGHEWMKDLLRDLDTLRES